MTTDAKNRILAALQNAARTARSSDEAVEARACEELLAAEGTVDAAPPPAPPAPPPADEPPPAPEVAP